jgi:peptidoglycan/xylan/chitin deacetylase (PgdA/CDA1 family)
LKVRLALVAIGFFLMLGLAAGGFLFFRPLETFGGTGIGLSKTTGASYESRQATVMASENVAYQVSSPTLPPVNTVEPTVTFTPTPSPSPTSTQPPSTATTTPPPPTATSTPAPAGTPTPLPDRVKVPILMYHYIRVNPESYDLAGYNLSVTPINFEAQVQWLTQNGYQTVSFPQLVAYFTDRRPLPVKPIILSFDDAYRDFYQDAYPILKKYGQTGTVFVITGFSDRPEYLTSDQIAELALAGIEFGGHTARHPDIRGIDQGTAIMEINASKRALEMLVGRPVVSFAYPAGGFNDWAVNLIKAAGYRAAVTTQEGMWHREPDLLTLSRVRISGSTTLDNMIKKLEAP